MNVTKKTKPTTENENQIDDLIDISNNLFSYSDSSISEKLLKYELYKSILEKAIPEESTIIKNVISELYETLLDIHNKEVSSENLNTSNDYSFSFFDFSEVLSKLNIEKRSDDDIVKIMFSISNTLEKYIERVKENFFNEYKNKNLKSLSTKCLSYKQISLEYMKILNEIGGQAKKDESNKSGYVKFCNNNYYFKNKEYAYINKIPKDICIMVLNDLSDSYYFITKLIDQVYNNFLDVISRFFQILNEEKDMSRIFLEDFSMSLIEDTYFKVSMTI